MKKSTIFFGIIGAIMLIIVGTYGFIAYKLYDTRSTIAENITEMRALYITLEEQQKEIETKYLPMIETYLDQADRKSTALRGLGILQSVAGSLPIVSSLPIPRIQEEVAASLSDVFDALDTLLNNSKKDFKSLIKTVHETLPVIREAIALQEQTAAGLKSVTTVSMIRSLFHI